MIPFTAKSFIKLDVYAGKEGLFIEGFSLDDTRNKNGWRATWESIKKYGIDFLGRPGIEYLKCQGSVCDRDHTNGSTYKQNMSVQELYRETNTIDVKIDEKSHMLSVVEEILSLQFEKKVESGTVKYRSPSLWPIRWEVIGNQDGRDLIDVHEWRALHNAYVDNPAFGDKAKILTQCKGHGSKCKVHFAASAESDNISHLQQIPVIIKHNNALQLVSVDECVQKIINQKISKGTPITDRDLATAYSECRKKKSTNSSATKLGALSGSCTPCQAKKLNYKYKKLQDSLVN